MKDKMKEKTGGSSDAISEAVDDFKKEPGILPGICENEPPGKNGDKNVSKVPDRSYLDSKSEIGPHPDDIKEEDDMLANKIKPENMGDGPVLFPTDGNENLMMGVVPVGEGLGGPGVPPTSGNVSGAGVQPLPSNVINKQPGTMEAQYMQQQSQIFVFSTSLANKAAESVLQGQYPSIIAYHCAQPGTKKYLEKHPLKLNQFNRHSPAQWLNNLAQMKQKPAFGGAPNVPPHMGGKAMPPRSMGDMPGGPGPRMMGPTPPVNELDNLPDNPDVNQSREMHPDFPPINVWNQQGNITHGNMNCPGPMRPMDREKPCAGSRQPPLMDPNFPSMNQFTLTGTKVPTENLTPQQRQHREEQLATLRKMQQMLFPENQSQTPDDFNNPRMMSVPPNQVDNAANNNANGRVGRTPMEVPIGSPMVNPPNTVGGSPLMNPGSNMVMGNDAVEPIPSSSPLPIQKMMSNNVAAQMEWHKLQHQFYEERKKKGRTESPAPRSGPHAKMGPGMSPMSGMPPQMQGPMAGMQGNMPPHVQGAMPPMQGNMPPQMQGMNPMQGGVQGMQGPPPPYHQTARSASVPIAVPSPNPGSPSNNTSNLSLPSPRTASDLNSPSDVNKLVKMTTCSPTNQGSPACSKMIASNPDTPVSAVSASQSPTPNKEIFGRNAGGMGPQKAGKPTGTCSNKEPNLMPVPSPQQIQYLNAFEGQELTIQKQPNTSLKDGSTSSPISGHPQISETPKCKTPTTSNNSPSQPPAPEMSPRYQQLPQSNPMSQQQNTPNPMTPHSAVPGAKDGIAVPSSPDNGPPGRSPCRSENMPLNPNGVPCAPSNKAVHFDPITSLAQMSQQLTSQAPTNCQGPPYPSNNLLPMDQGMHIDGMDNLPFVPQQGPGLMDLPPGYMSDPSPKPSMANPPTRCVAPPFFGGSQFPRMMGPNTYNGMNVQVKASTPNTIQYLPARPTGNSPNPGIRNPPSLDFLQRFANPGPEGKPPMFMGCHPGMEAPNPNMMLGGNMMGGNMLRGQLRPGMKPGPPGMVKSSGPGPVFDPMAMNNPGLYKGSPLGMPPDASQPLPPSMSQGNNFKNSPFVGPTVADPNYAQQFHNFQQQLYATNTRSQLNSHLNQSYFMPK